LAEDNETMLVISKD